MGGMDCRNVHFRTRPHRGDDNDRTELAQTLHLKSGACRLVQGKPAISQKCTTSNDTDMDIVNLISTTCSCDKQTAQEYLEAEVRHLQELQELSDLREDDLYMACSNLGIEDDYVEYFINRVAMA